MCNINKTINYILHGFKVAQEQTESVHYYKIVCVCVCFFYLANKTAVRFYCVKRSRCMNWKYSTYKVFFF